jgi:hypothetical protein
MKQKYMSPSVAITLLDFNGNILAGSGLGATSVPNQVSLDNTGTITTGSGDAKGSVWFNEEDE